MKYEIIYYKVQYQVSGAYIVLNIQVVPHARKSLRVRVITADSYILRVFDIIILEFQQCK